MQGVRVRIPNIHSWARITRPSPREHFGILHVQLERRSKTPPSTDFTLSAYHTPRYLKQWLVLGFSASGVYGLPTLTATTPSNSTRTMSGSTSYLVALPIEILERALLCLPGKDIVKIQTVRRIKTSSRGVVYFSLGQLALSRPRSYIARPTVPMRPFRHRYDR